MELQPTPAWDALFASKVRDFLGIVLKNLVEPWDPQAICNLAKAVLFDGNVPDVEVYYDHAYFELHPKWAASTTLERGTGRSEH